MSAWPDFSEQQIERARTATEQKCLRTERRENQRKQQHQIKARERMKKEIMLAVQRKNERMRTPQER